MATATLYPNGNGTFPTGWGGSGTPAGNYTEVKDASDLTFASAAANSISAFYLFDDTPADVGAVTAVDFSFRCAKSAKSPARNFTTIQCVQSDESTALTGTADVSGGSTSATTITGSLTITGLTTKAAWDGMRLKITTASTGSGTAFLYDVYLTITYSLGGRVHRAAAMDGLGGVGQQRFNPVLCSKPIWTPPKKAIFVPAFTLAK